MYEAGYGDAYQGGEACRAQGDRQGPARDLPDLGVSRKDKFQCDAERIDQLGHGLIKGLHLRTV
jgi:hypothetical protein